MEDVILSLIIFIVLACTYLVWIAYTTSRHKTKPLNCYWLKRFRKRFVVKPHASDRRVSVVFDLSQNKISLVRHGDVLEHMYYSMSPDDIGSYLNHLRKWSHHRNKVKERQSRIAFNIAMKEYGINR